MKTVTITCILFLKYFVVQNHYSLIHCTAKNGILECFCIKCWETLGKKNQKKKQRNPQGPVTYDHLIFGHFHVVLVGFVGIHDMGCRNIKTYVTGPRGFIYSRNTKLYLHNQDKLSIFIFN